jgi:Tripartite tricarboxylate transporter family receptor
MMFLARRRLIWGCARGRNRCGGSQLGRTLVQHLAQQDDNHSRTVSTVRKRRSLGAAISRAPQDAFGQPVLVENKPGAGGNLAGAEAARSQPDGHTLFIGTNGTQTINQSLYRHLSYDPATDFTAIGMM